MPQSSRACTDSSPLSEPGSERCVCRDSVPLSTGSEIDLSIQDPVQFLKLMVQAGQPSLSGLSLRLVLTMRVFIHNSSRGRDHGRNYTVTGFCSDRNNALHAINYPGSEVRINVSHKWLLVELENLATVSQVLTLFEHNNFVTYLAKSPQSIVHGIAWIGLGL